MQQEIQFKVDQEQTLQIQKATLQEEKSKLLQLEYDRQQVINVLQSELQSLRKEREDWKYDQMLMKKEIDRTRPLDQNLTEFLADLKALMEQESDQLARMVGEEEDDGDDGDEERKGEWGEEMRGRGSILTLADADASERKGGGASSAPPPPRQQDINTAATQGQGLGLGQGLDYGPGQELGPGQGQEAQGYSALYSRIRTRVHSNHPTPSSSSSFSSSSSSSHPSAGMMETSMAMAMAMTPLHPSMAKTPGFINITIIIITIIIIITAPASHHHHQHITIILIIIVIPLPYPSTHQSLISNPITAVLSHNSSNISKRRSFCYQLSTTTPTPTTTAATSTTTTTTKPIKKTCRLDVHPSPSPLVATPARPHHRPMDRFALLRQTHPSIASCPHSAETGVSTVSDGRR